MKSIPSISSQIDQKIIFKTIEKNFSKLAPYYYSFISNWLIRAYKCYHDIDKFIIVIYLINKDLIFFQFNGRSSIDVDAGPHKIRFEQGKAAVEPDAADYLRKHVFFRQGRIQEVVVG